MLPEVCNSDIVCVNETWATDDPSILISNYFPDCDVIYSKATKTATRGRARGGLLVVYNKNKYSTENLFINEECVFVKFVSRNFKFIIGFIYTSPTSDFDSFLATLDFQISQISFKFFDTPIYLGGDFNFRMGNLNQLSNEIILSDWCISEERYLRILESPS